MKSAHVYRVMLVIVAVAVSEVTAQRTTIPQEVARTRPEPVRFMRITELADVKLDELFARADTIVHGVASRSGAHLSSDQRAVHTDYVVTPKRIFRQRASRVGKPGVVDPIGFTQWGGKMLYDGVVVECYDQDVPLVEDGVEGVFFLTFDPRTNRNWLVREAGALNVKANRIVPLLKSPILDAVRGWELGELLRDVEVRVNRGR